MSFVPIPNVASLDVIWTQEGENVENTFHYHFGAAITEANLKGLCDTYSAWASANSALFSDVCELVKMEARDLTTATSLRVEENVAPPVHGTDVSGQLPNNVTFALKRQTGLAGRANRGRVYLIGVARNRLGSDQQTFDPSSAVNYVLAYDQLNANQFSDNAADEVIAHKSLGTFTHVTGYAFSDLFLDSQRRRLKGHNRHH